MPNKVLDLVEGVLVSYLGQVGDFFVFVGKGELLTNAPEAKSANEQRFSL